VRLGNKRQSTKGAIPHRCLGCHAVTGRLQRLSKSQGLAIDVTTLAADPGDRKKT
jgi:hypothetical protein